MIDAMEVIDRLAKLLDRPLTVRPEFGEPIETTTGARFAELVAVNGGRMTVGGWGVISLGGMYGRQGLNQDEAMELMQVANFLMGIAFAVPEAKAFVGKRLAMYWDAQQVQESA